MNAPKTTTKEHPELAAILAYVGKRMDEEESFQLETHLGICDQCVSRVRAHFAVKDLLDELFDPSAVMEVALAPSAEPVPVRLPERLRDVEKRIREMLSGIPQGLEVALKVLIDSRKKMAKVIREGLEGLGRERRSPRFLYGFRYRTGGYWRDG